MNVSLLSLMSAIGVIAFAISGAMLAIEKEMDIFGVNILAVLTALGGGLTRDVIIDVAPPALFQSPGSILLAVFMANICFLIAYFHKKLEGQLSVFYDKGIFWTDTLGLAAFVVDGVATTMNMTYRDNLLIVVFVGVITGVGGGVLRDVLANELPVIFVKHIYASAALIGALFTAILWNYVDENVAMTVGFFMIVLIRVLASHFRLNLPRIRHD